MPTNEQRRETERRRLQRQLEERRAREIARRRFTLIGSIIGSVVVIAAIVVIVVISTSGNKKNTNAGEKDTITGSPTTGTTQSSPAPTSITPSNPVATAPIPTAPCAPPSGATAAFKGLTVAKATDLKSEPKFTGKVTTDPTTVVCRDLVVGKGKAAGTNASVTAQYVGAVGKTGQVFQSSWGSGQQPTFTLTAGPSGVIAGFAQGIGGAGKIAPMHVGGRRVIIMPAGAGYGANPPSGSNIPPNATLVFIVDLVNVNG